jgi:ADP-ribosylglycohydrolase
MTETANAKGCLLGLACGDALDRPVECKRAKESASQHADVTEMLWVGSMVLQNSRVTVL